MKALFALEPGTADGLTIWGFVATVLGLVIGVVGFLYTIHQVRKVKAVAEAAEEAATATRAESRASYERFVGAFASRLMSEMTQTVSANNWIAAAMRSRDVAELLGTLPGTMELVSELRAFGEIFVERAEGRSPRYAITKWRDHITRIHVRLDPLRAPFRDPNYDEVRTDRSTSPVPPDRGIATRENPPPPGELGSDAHQG